MWRATFRSLPTGAFAQRAKVPHGAGIRFSVPSAELAENFLFSAKGVPKGPRLIFSRQRKNFFTAGGLRGSRDFGGGKILEERNEDEKRVQNGC